MPLEFETLGNATLLFHEDGKPVLATDPWLTGTCYFGSWGLERPLTPGELHDMQTAEYIWISHGHPDHLHSDSLALLSRSQKILLPDHYLPDIAEWLRSEGFAVDVLPYRTWRRLTPQLRVMCLDNENQDAILIVEAGDSLIVNLNDSPIAGERRFIRNLVRGYDRQKTYMAKLCAYDADMINIVDRNGKLVIGDPEERKRGTVLACGRVADQIGVGHFVSSSSQHIYLRADSAWANPYRVIWADVERHWSRPHIAIIEPFVRIDLQTGTIERKHPTQASDLSRVTAATADDDWSETLNAEEAARVDAFFRRSQLLQFDHVDIIVGGVRQRVWLDEAARGRPEDQLKGFGFHVPRRSLMECVESGFFGDLFIGNFMKTELHNATLWPGFTPVIAMLASNAKVYTKAEHRGFLSRYFRRNPAGFLEGRLDHALDVGAVNLIRGLADRIGLKAPLKKIYRRLIGDTVSA